MKITPTVAHTILSQNRSKAAIAANAFAVRSVNKDGSISKSADTSFTVAATEEEAESIKTRMEGLNPGRKFVVVSK
jgi:hypothetical protein